MTDAPATEPYDLLVDGLLDDRYEAGPAGPVALAAFRRCGARHRDGWRCDLHAGHTGDHADTEKREAWPNLRRD